MSHVPSKPRPTRCAFFHSPQMEQFALSSRLPVPDRACREDRSTPAVDGTAVRPWAAGGGAPPGRAPGTREVSSARYLDVLERACDGDMDVDALHMGLGTPDTPIFKGLHAYASLAAGRRPCAELIAAGEPTSRSTLPAATTTPTRSGRAGSATSTTWCWPASGSRRRAARALPGHRRPPLRRRAGGLLRPQGRADDLLSRERRGRSSPARVGRRRSARATATRLLRERPAARRHGRRGVPPRLPRGGHAADEGVTTRTVIVAGNGHGHAGRRPAGAPVPDEQRPRGGGRSPRGDSARPILAVGGGGYHVENTVRGWAWRGASCAAISDADDAMRAGRRDDGDHRLAAAGPAATARRPLPERGNES